ncbi:cupin domain-containing protein [Aminithiophilus ramosus]|uniref:Cupin domain-containing protein n=2 Tax=Synergistales TaxID=649776 RepID=A0A9Q7A7X2_9BACT|nr:cupin domain-containing protein [Aminithiophilus ramosus]QTX32326.1 cupin domain-containing protein [Aminithiophilus ramosus]QVL36191.1 cupin domain-containing protein [Synergistota bacterium]
MKKGCLALALFFCLTSPAAAHEGPHVDVLAKTTSSWDGTTLASYPEGQPEITVLHITVPPKTSLALHRHPVINAAVLLEGELTVITEKEETLHVKAGEALVEVVDKWHYGRNDGDVPVVLVVFYAGTEGGAITVNKE